MTSEVVHSPMVSYSISICGLDEICTFAGARVTHALSILDPDWPDPPDFASFGACRREIMHFDDIIDELPGKTGPSEAHVAELLAFGQRLRREAVGHLLVHCHAGISRSTAATAILLSQFNPGAEERAFAEIGRIRAWNWPNSRMIEHADRLLGRSGRLVAALRAHHRRMIEVNPQRSAHLKLGDRAREYRLAMG